MILWLALFLLVIAISFILAFLSMREYHESPKHSKEEYGLFLIRHIQGLNAEVLDNIGELIQLKDLIISIERLFKGKQTALTIFGPKIILEQFAKPLNLSELEDYSLDLDNQKISIWEVGVRNQNPGELTNIFKNLPELNLEDQFLWQIILAAKGKGIFHTQIRAAIFSPQPARRKALAPILQNLGVDKLVKIPRPFTPSQMMEFYKLRSLSRDSKGPVLTVKDLFNLVKV